MADNPDERSILKSYFTNGSIPTESQFAELINSMLIQDAGIAKQSGNPLRITAEGDSTGSQKVINFYDIGETTNPSWSLQLNPGDLNNKTNQAGFCITDGMGTQRLRINNTDTGANKITLYGLVNILDAEAADDDNIVKVNMIEGSLNIGSNIKSYGSSGDENANTAGLLLTTAANTEIAVNEYTKQIASLMYYQGNGLNKITIGRDIGYNTIPVNIAGNLSVMGWGQIFDGNGFLTNKWMTNGSLTIGSTTTSYGGSTSHIGYANNNLAGLLLITQHHTEIAVNDSGNQKIFSLLYYEGQPANNITIGRDMGWGNTPVTIASDLEVNRNLVVSGGILDFDPDSPSNFSIELCGTANVGNSKGSNNYLIVNGNNIYMTISRGLNTVILNFDGSLKKDKDGNNLAINYDVYNDGTSDSNKESTTNWNDWAVWVNKNTVFGDIVAVASFDAIGNAPSPGDAYNLLMEIGAYRSFSINDYNPMLQAPYALLFIKGRKAIEYVSTSGSINAVIKIKYQNLLQQWNCWINVTTFMYDFYNMFDGDYTKTGTRYNPAQYYKNNEGFVRLRGCISTITPGPVNTIIFKLPQGYWPEYQEVHSVIVNGNLIGELDIHQDGTVSFITPKEFNKQGATPALVTQVNSVWLDGIVFKAYPF